MLSHHAIAQDNPCYPVHALVICIINMLNNGAEPQMGGHDTSMAASMQQRYGEGSPTCCGSPWVAGKWIQPEVDWLHSLHTGGATALYINKKML